MQRALTISRSTVGNKAIMAVTGVILFGFVIGHMVGNLQVFGEPEALTRYAATLRKLGALLWLVRAVMLVSLVLHIRAAIVLATRNADAREVDYQHRRRDQVTDYAARTMMWSGPILGMYLLFHILHLTFGYGSTFDHQNVFNNVVYGFRVWWLSATYIVANLLLGVHLFHGAWSWFQSLGLNHPRYNSLRRAFAIAFAAIITIGNVSIPVAVMTGMVEPTSEHFCYPELASTEGECDGFDN